ncbi:hypothetical protein NKI31_12085 [Mesorhizobium sp. M0659]|uniref:hypothetical protein n=1 Tax=Mesorhizobium sp. M0659 TaxID=2956980 RepID=UPI00333D12EF
MAKTMPADIKLGEIGQEILFENEKVRIWGLSLEPKEIQTWHQHHLPYVIIPLTKGDNIMRFADGREKQTNETVGGVLWREPGVPHELENCSDWTYQNVLIEIKS